MAKARNRFGSNKESRVVTIGELLGETGDSHMNEEESQGPAFGVNEDVLLTEGLDADDVQDSDIERIVAEIGNDLDPTAFVSIMRIDPIGKRPDSHCMKTNVSDFSIDDVRRRYGGGTYRIRGYAPKEGRRGAQLFMNRVITVEEPRPGTEETVIPVNNTSSELSQLLQVMQVQQREFQQTMLTLLQNQSKDKNSRADFMSELVVLKDFFVPTHVAPSNTKGTMEQLKELLELKKLLADDIPVSNSDSPMLSLGLKMFDKLGEMQKFQASNIVDNSATPPRGVAPVPASSPYAPPPTQPIEDVNMEQQRAINMLVNAATTNGDVNQWANLLYDELPEDVFVMMITAPNWFEQISTLDTRIALYPDWFTQVRNRLIEMYQEANAPKSTLTPAHAPSPTPSHGPTPKPQENLTGKQSTVNNAASSSNGAKDANQNTPR